MRTYWLTIMDDGSAVLKLDGEFILRGDYPDMHDSVSAIMTAIGGAGEELRRTRLIMSGSPMGSFTLEIQTADRELQNPGALATLAYA